MKKCFILIFIYTLLVSLFPLKVSAQKREAANNSLSIDSPSAILIEYSTGNILYSKNETEKMYPASMTKMMSMYLLLECIKHGESSFNDMVTVSGFASSMGGSQIFLKENEKMTFEDLFTAIAVASANDAVVALAEYTYGSTDSFVNKMNEKAKEFKMYNTNFINTTGFHDENHYTTAQDMAILARRLIHDYNDTILKYTSIYETYLREDSENPFWLVNTNKLLNSYDGMDGLKTGYTSESGYNLTATASRNNLRFISVIMGGNTSKSRNNDISTLLDYGFNNYKLETLYTKGETIKELRFINAREETTPVIAKEDINVLLKKTEKMDGVVINIDIFDNSAPKSNDQIIGKITIRSKNGDLLSENNLYVKENVIKLTFIDIFINFLKIMS